MWGHTTGYFGLLSLSTLTPSPGRTLQATLHNNHGVIVRLMIMKCTPAWMLLLYLHSNSGHIEALMGRLCSSSNDPSDGT